MGAARSEMKGNKCRPVPTPTADAYHAGLVLDEKLWFDPKTKTLHYDWDSECERFVRFQCGNFRIHIERLNGDNPVERLFLVDYRCKNARGSYHDFVLQREIGSVPLTKEYVEGWVDRIKKSLEEPSPQVETCYSKASQDQDAPKAESSSASSSRPSVRSNSSYATKKEVSCSLLVAIVALSMTFCLLLGAYGHGSDLDHANKKIFELTRKVRELEGALTQADQRISRYGELHNSLAGTVYDLRNQLKANEQQTQLCTKQTHDLGDFFENAWKAIKQV